jgi:multicomponent K+:H+ antiporter subunit A
MAFDLGVACVVVGAVLMALAQLAQVAQRAAKPKRRSRHEP